MAFRGVKYAEIFMSFSVEIISSVGMNPSSLRGARLPQAGRRRLKAVMNPPVADTYWHKTIHEATDEVNGAKMRTYFRFSSGSPLYIHVYDFI